MKSKSDYVKKEFVETMEEQINEYIKFKSLINEWGKLGIINSKLLMKTNERKRSQN